THDVDLLLDPLAAILEVLAERLELDGVPADADAQAEPSAREHVHGGRLLGDERGLALRQDHDAGHQLGAPRDPRAESEEDEGLVERVLVGVLAAPAARPVGGRADDAVASPHGRVAHRLDGLGVVADRRRIPADLGLRKHDADLHAITGWRGRPGARRWSRPSFARPRSRRRRVVAWSTALEPPPRRHSMQLRLLKP